MVVLLVTLSLVGGGLVVWRLIGTGASDGAIIGAAQDGKSREEIQEQLNREVEENMMTVSILPSPRLAASGMLEVGFENDAANKFGQRFTLVQGGKTIYESKPIEPGQRIDAVRPDGIALGSATVEVQAVDAESGADHGSPTAVQVNVVSKPSEAADGGAATDQATAPDTGTE